MKFHWFAAVTYDGLPAGFPAPGQGAWVDSPAGLADPRRVGENYRMFLRLMQQADRDGFDGLAVNEHHQTPFAMTPSPNLLAAGLAGSTERAAILVIHLFGNRVIPQLRDLWADQPDHWTPPVTHRAPTALVGGN